MNIYLDTEMEGLWKSANLISLGLVSDDGKEIYIEFNDIDIDKQSDWIKQNVLANTVYYGNADVNSIINEDNYYVGNKTQIQGVLREWFRQFKDVQIVSDVSHYDFVQFVDIFGTAFDLPDNISPSCHDINQDIANYYFISDADAFNLSREDILDDSNYVDGAKHNAMYDARVIKNIYNSINNGLN